MWTRRQALGGMFAGGFMLAGRGAPAELLQAQSAPAIIPPNGIAETQPRLQGIRRVIVDTDPGNDDALALLMAVAAPQLVIDAVTVCPGNMGTERYDQQVRNALFLVDLAGKSGKIPVYRGMAKPLLNRPYPVATFIHGKYGLGDVEVPEVKQKPETEHAVDMMIRAVNAAPGEITILALGGLTNIAMAILRDPEFAKKLKGIVFVGGRYATPGMPPSYNVLVDPEAAHIVFSSGALITLNAADISNRDSILVAADYDRAEALHTKWSRFFIESNNLRRTYEMKYRGATGSVNADPMAVSLAIDPSIGRKFMRVFVRVELAGEYTRGMLVYGDDIYTGHPIPQGNVDLCVQADAEKFKALVFRTLAMET
ncbi:nucleoside hydrolase [Granulicella sibirica]|uniref:Inosine-uridine preferring nucleoside hydrolase n=1 Tax=Granulicella sibirica TaxID=2479048 RepID=A0A4Q0SXH4_9BACT|nr:nucleoside hydrolase [Granulicella sibirica]RXH54690.1 Inosine-uridine preferring nucleoside hydrolase [Granulicella sibirica]